MALTDVKLSVFTTLPERSFTIIERDSSGRPLKLISVVAGLGYAFPENKLEIGALKLVTVV